jgi:hypothetical protein
LVTATSGFVIDDDDFDILAAHLAAEILHGEIEAVAGLLAEHGAGAGQRHDHADLDLFLSKRGHCCGAHQCGKSC